ncbi:MAG: DinB family protein [Thermoprotei archaeon]
MLGYVELFDYFKRERDKIVSALEKMPEEEFTKNRELSFYSIKDVLVHTILVEDNWLHYRAMGKGEAQVKLENFKNLDDVKRYMREVDRKTSELFRTLKPEDLKREVRRVYPDGRVSVYTLEQVLYHVPIEVIHHYGEIFAEFWKMNLDAPYYSYLNYSKEVGS